MNCSFNLSMNDEKIIILFYFRMADGDTNRYNLNAFIMNELSFPNRFVSFFKYFVEYCKNITQKN